jgi:hypothetical protein
MVFLLQHVPAVQSAKHLLPSFACNPATDALPTKQNKTLARLRAPSSFSR